MYISCYYDVSHKTGLILYIHSLFQPDELTDVLEISNIVFTSLFALEMLLKLSACGLLGYISNPYNIFDGIIVIIRFCAILFALHLL